MKPALEPTTAIAKIQINTEALSPILDLVGMPIVGLTISAVVVFGIVIIAIAAMGWRDRYPFVAMIHAEDEDSKILAEALAESVRAFDRG